MKRYNVVHSDGSVHNTIHIEENAPPYIPPQGMRLVPLDPDPLREMQDEIAYLMTPGAFDEAPPPSPDLSRLESIQADLKNGARETPAPETMEYGAGPSAEAEVEDLISRMKSDPDAADAAIRGLSAERRRILTESFQQRMNELNNDRLRGVKLNSFDGEWLEDRQTLVHKLAVLGDGG